MVERAGGSESEKLKITTIKIGESDVPLAADDQAVVFAENFRDFTITYAEDADNLQIFDRNGQLVRDFAAIAQIKQTVNWKEFGDAIGKKFISREAPSNSDIPLRNLPPGLYRVARTQFSNDGKSYISMENMADSEFSLASPRFSVLADGKYIVIFDSINKIVFQTQDNAGEPIPEPRNWIRYDVTSTLPPELEELLDEMDKFPGALNQSLNNDFSAIIRNDDILIVDKATGDPVFDDNVAGIGRNLCVDPHNDSVIYYCRSGSPTGIIRLDMSGLPGSWTPEELSLNDRLHEVSRLSFDPTGNFFLVSTLRGTVVLERDTLTSVGKMSNFRNASADSIGNIKGVLESSTGSPRLIFYKSNLANLAEHLEDRRIGAEAGQISAFPGFGATAVVSGGLVSPESALPEDKLIRLTRQFGERKQARVVELQVALDPVTEVALLHDAREWLVAYRDALKAEGRDDVSY
jgi:hypothetical protein